MQSRSRFLSSLGGTLLVAGCSGGPAALSPQNQTLSSSRAVTLDLAQSTTLAKSGVMGFRRKGQLFVLHPKAPRVYSAVRAMHKLDDSVPQLPYPYGGDPTYGGGLGGYPNGGGYFDPSSGAELQVIGSTVSYTTFPINGGGGGYESDYNGGGFSGFGGGPVAIGDINYTPDPPPLRKDCVSDAVGVGLGLVGLATAIVGTGLASNPAVGAAASGFLAGTVAGVTFAGIILAELPWIAIAATALTVGLTLATLALYLRCEAG